MKTKELEEITSVTYSFADGTKVVQPINKEVFVDYKGRKKSINEVLQVFHTTALDKKATSFTLDGDVEDAIVVNEQHFTTKERKNAKRDYAEFKAMNSVGFFKEQQKFRSELIDKLSKRVRFNLTKLSNLN